MKSKYPQISQITQMVTAEEMWGGSEFQAAPLSCLHHLCNLRNLRRHSFKENQWTY
jgi:hypothetical protein